MKSVLLFFFLSHVLFAQGQEAPKPVDLLLKEAYEQAAKEQKNVFVVFRASWCGWCHKMEAGMNEPELRSFFQDNYVVVWLTVLEPDDKKHLENSGAEAFMNQYGGKDQGIPYWLIFNPRGSLLADALQRPPGAGPAAKGVNVGCPAQEEEVAHFVSVLKRTSSLKEEQLNAIARRFRQNAL